MEQPSGSSEGDDADDDVSFLCAVLDAGRDVDLLLFDRHCVHATWTTTSSSKSAARHVRCDLSPLYHDRVTSLSTSGTSFNVDSGQFNWR